MTKIQVTSGCEHSTSLQLILFTILFFYKNCSKPVLVIKSKEVMKIILKQIHQTGEVHHTLAGQLTRTLDVLGRASALHIAAKKLILRSLVRVSLLTSCTFPRTGLDKQVERVARKTSEQVTVCVLSTRMSCVFNPERTRQRGLLPLRGET